MEQLIKPNTKLRTEILQVQVNAVQENYNFGQQPQLREAAVIVSIQAYSRTQMAKSPNGLAVVTETVLKNCFLNLVALGTSDLKLAEIPFFDLQKQFGGQANNLIEQKFNFQPIDWEKSTLKVVDTTGLALNEVFLLKVTYLKK